MFKPDFFTFIPKIHEENSAEFFDDIFFEPILTNYTSESDINKFRAEVENSFHSMLSMVDQHQLKEKIAKNPELVTFLELKKSDLANFVNLNPLVASEIIYTIMQSCNIKE